MDKLVAYLRVSTDEQGQCGLGIEAQRHTINTWAAANGATILQEIVEVASGAKVNRPGLAEAMAAAKAEGAKLIVSKLDRLSRDLEQVAGLMKRGPPIIMIDLQVNTASATGEATIHFMATVAQLERRLIGERTKAALARLKANPKTRARHPGVRNRQEARVGYQGGGHVG